MKEEKVFKWFLIIAFSYFAAHVLWYAFRTGGLDLTRLLLGLE